MKGVSDGKEYYRKKIASEIRRIDNVELLMYLYFFIKAKSKVG